MTPPGNFELLRDSKYKHLFFDLDHTLWDFERNSTESLEEIFHLLALGNYGIHSSARFIECFLTINQSLWNAFDRGDLHHGYIRENRFRLVFTELGVECPTNHAEIGEMYLKTLPGKKHLLAGAQDVLNYAYSMGYQMHIITNGFNDVQAQKIESSSINHFFQHVITFESADAKKPETKIFAYALEVANAAVGESLMIGDNWIADILGAKRFGMDTVYYNPAGLTFEEDPTYDIRHLEELKWILRAGSKMGVDPA